MMILKEEIEKLSDDELLNLLDMVSNEVKKRNGDIPSINNINKDTIYDIINKFFETPKTR